jgi:hypothetical protein
MGTDAEVHMVACARPEIPPTMTTEMHTESAHRAGAWPYGEKVWPAKAEEPIEIVMS